MVSSLMTASTDARAASPHVKRSRAPERAARPCVPAPPACRLLKKQDRRDEESRARLRDRVRGEFSEMPCLRVTCQEAARLFGLRADVCVRVLGELEDSGDIRQGPDGRFSRLGAVA